MILNVSFLCYLGMVPPIRNMRLIILFIYSANFQHKSTLSAQVTGVKLRPSRFEGGRPSELKTQ
jgi:hypothetical protein